MSDWGSLTVSRWAVIRTEGRPDCLTDSAGDWISGTKSETGNRAPGKNLWQTSSDITLERGHHRLNIKHLEWLKEECCQWMHLISVEVRPDRPRAHRKKLYWWCVFVPKLLFNLTWRWLRHYIMILADNGESSLESSKSKGVLFCTRVQQSPTAKSL